MVKSIGKITITFFMMVFLCFTFLVLSYKMPTTAIEKNVAESLDVFNSEGMYPVRNETGTKLDNYTDALILSESLHVGNRSVEDAMLGASYKPIKFPVDALNSYFKGNREVEPYTQYWHGNLVVSRLLLSVFNYSEIRSFNYIMLILLLLVVIFLMYKRNIGLRYIAAFVLSLALIKGHIVPLSMQFSCMFYLMFAEIIIMLKYHNWIAEKNRYIYFFLIAGILTSYFDFLTTPILSLGIPLIFLSVIDAKSSGVNFVKMIFIYSFIWAVGYFGMWIMKWVLGTMFTDINVISVGIKNFTTRTGLETYLGPATMKNAIRWNFIEGFGVHFKRYVGLTVLLITALIVYMYKADKDTVISVLPIFLITVFPIVWYVVLKNHSIVHAWFTYRSLLISTFGLMVIICKCLSLNKNTIRQDSNKLNI